MNNTLSIIPSDGGSNEFPVLKAFQEYIDAEQAKARKRMLGLSVFFIVLLIVVVITFVLVLTTVVNRNQALSDRLLDYALKERERQPIVQQVPVPAPTPTPVAPQISAQEILKPFIERLEREQAAMKEAYARQKKEFEEKAAANETLRDEEMRKIRAELEKERDRAKKENDRKEEIERHRRRLYPDYYRIPSLQTENHSVKAEQNKSTQVSIPPSVPNPAVEKVKTSSHETKKASPLSSIKPVTYFNMDDDDSVPFLLETPKPTQK